MDPEAVTGRRRRARWPWLAALAVGIGVLAFVLVWFEPQALFIDERVSDPVPVAADEPMDDAVVPGPTTTVVAEPVELAAGDLESIDHGTSGRVRVLQLADGSRYVRLEGLRTENGPALRVYLSANPADGPEGAFDDTFVDLGD